MPIQQFPYEHLTLKSNEVHGNIYIHIYNYISTISTELLNQRRYRTPFTVYSTMAWWRRTKQPSTSHPYVSIYRLNYGSIHASCGYALTCACWYACRFDHCFFLHIICYKYTLSHLLFNTLFVRSQSSF